MGARRRFGWMLALVAAALLGVGLSACGSSGTPSYEVRAIFDDAGNVIPGEDVKVAGVKVGSVQSLDVTPDQKAAVVLNITDAGFQDFRTDANCIVRPQALIGEMFVDCTPTQPRAVGVPEPPALPLIRHGAGAGQYYLPVTNTSSPVGLDLIGDISRLPYTQRLSIIINELGAGLAGNGQALEQVVQRADPTLAALDRVLAILASENHTLAQLATESDIAVAPLAATRHQIADFIANSNTVATVQAQHRAALGQVLAKLPGFLDALTPTLRELSGTADAANPVLANLAAAAPDVNAVTQNLVPLSQATSAYLVSFGQTAKPGVAQIEAAQPVATSLQSLGAVAQPFGQNTAALLQGVDKQQGLKDILDFIFRGSLASNGYDQAGHFLRNFGVIIGNCIVYDDTTVNTDCQDGNFTGASGTTASTARAARARAHAATARAASTSTPAGGAAAPAGGGSTSSSTTNTMLSYLLGE